MSQQSIRLKARWLPSTDVVPFLSNSTQRIDLPRTNAIRRILMHFYIEHVGGASDPTEIEDTILKIIKGIRIIQDGDDRKFSMTGQQWFYREKSLKGTEPSNNRTDNQLGSSTTKTWFVTLAADFALFPTNLADIQALLPARKFTQLKLEIDWGAVGDMFSANPGTITVANSGCRVHIYEVIDQDDNDSFSRGLKKNFNFLDVRQQIDSLPITTTYANLEEAALTRNLAPTPALIRNHLMLVKTSAGVLTDANVDQLAIVDTRNSGETLYRTNLSDWKRQMKNELALEAYNDGVYFFDHVEFQNGGIQNIFNEGDLKLKFKVPVGSGSIEIVTDYIAGKA